VTAPEMFGKLLIDKLDDHRTSQDDHVMVLARRLNHRALCSCRWLGRRRVLLAAAKVDALIHAAQTNHTPAIPLVVRKAK
jgi:hypothetical protein